MSGDGAGWSAGIMRAAVLAIGLWATQQASAASPEVSSSRGKTDGVVVLWPRIVPETEDPVIIDLARQMQTRLEEAAVATVPENRVDKRPSPERVCPRSGCKATSLGILFGHQDGGCALLGIVGPPGTAPQRLVPLAGRFQMEDPYLPFRDPPEGDVIVAEFVPCAELAQHIDPQVFGLLLPKPIQ